jgi:hypothetical protein
MYTHSGEPRSYTEQQSSNVPKCALLCYFTLSNITRGVSLQKNLVHISKKSLKIPSPQECVKVFWQNVKKSLKIPKNPLKNCNKYFRIFVNPKNLWKSSGKIPEKSQNLHTLFWSDTLFVTSVECTFHVESLARKWINQTICQCVLLSFFAAMDPKCTYGIY